MVRYASVLFGLAAIAMTVGSVGCGASVQRVATKAPSTPHLGNVATIEPGLANAARLGGDPADDGRGHDVIANAGDSCGQNGIASSPLRGHWPPCPNVEQASSRIAPDLVAPLPAPPPDQAELVLPYAGPFYSLWLCWERSQRAPAKHETSQSRIGTDTATASLNCASP